MKVPINPQTRVPQGQLGYERNVDISSGARALAGVVDKYAQELKADEKKRELFDVQRMLVEETNALQLDFDERVKTQPLGAPDFTPTINNDYNTRHGGMVETLREKGYSEDAVQELATRLGTIRSQYVARAIDFQDKSDFAKRGKDAEGLAISLSQYATQNPNAVDSSLDEFRVAISNLGLDAIEQEQVYEQNKGIILQGARQGFALQNPEAVISLFDPEDPAALPGSSSVELADLKGPEKTVSSELSGVGFRPVVVAGFLGNFKVEGGYGGAQGDSGTAGGIAQWRGSRRANFIAQIGKDPTKATHAEQAKFVVWEMQNPDEAGMTVDQRDAILNAKTAEEAAELIDKYYERSNGSARSQRIEAAKLFVKTMDKADATITSLVVPGNIDVSQITPVSNADGTVSTVRSISIEEDGKTYLIPTVVNGKVVSDDEAVVAFHETGQHLGIFKDQATADAYAKQLSRSEGRRVDAAGRTGIPIIDLSTGPERMQMLAWAKQHSAEGNANERAGLEVTHQNAVNAYLATGDYAGALPSVERYTKLYGPVVGPQKFAELQNAAEVGRNIQQFKTLPADQIETQVEALRPKDTASPTYTEELQAFNKAREAADSILKARDDNPSGYLFSTFPNVAKQIRTADEPDERKIAYSAINEAYKKLGIASEKRYIMTDESAKELQREYDIMSPAQKIRQLSEWADELGELHNPFMRQLTADGYGAGADNVMHGLLRRHPNGFAIMSQILEGQQVIKEDPARKPSPDAINTAFKSTIGTALARLNPGASKIYNDAAAAIYVANGGQTEGGMLKDPDLYEESLRQAVGGLPGNKNTGIINMSKGAAQDWTILPQRTTETEFTNWVERLTPGVLERLSIEQTPPVYRSGNPVPLEDIIDEGVFVAIAPNHYIIKMASDGKPLGTPSGNNFVVRIRPQGPARPAAPLRRLTSRRPTGNPAIDATIRMGK